MLMLAVPAPNCARGSVPSRLLAELAMIAYGIGKMGWRGERVVNDAAPFVRTPISSQRFDPVNTLLPKSSITANNPLVTPVTELVIGPATVLPPLLVAKSAKVIS